MWLMMVLQVWSLGFNLKIGFSSHPNGPFKNDFLIFLKTKLSISDSVSSEQGRDCARDRCQKNARGKYTARVTALPRSILMLLSTFMSGHRKHFGFQGRSPKRKNWGSGGRAPGKTFEGSGAKPLEKIKNPRRAISPNCPAWTPARRAPGGKKKKR